jgi:5-methylcytosine-specific restriction endonuclease McrA
MHSVIVLNTDFSFLHTISWKRAITLMMQGKVEVLKYGEHVAASIRQKIRIPLVVRLIKFVRQIYKNKVPMHKKNILVRDGFTCQYCGVSCRAFPTLDHIIPKSRGGKCTWNNTVTACRSCNQKKGSKTPREAGLSLLKKPVQPTISEFMHIKMQQLGIRELLDDLLSPEAT